MVRAFAAAVVAAYALVLGPMFAPSQRALAQEAFKADNRINVTSTIVANNTTAIVVSAKPSTVYLIEAFNNGTALAYIKLYDSATSVTCGQTSPPPKWRGMIPFGASSSGGGFGLPNINGDAYAFGVVMCITGAITDADTTAPAAATYIVNVHWKALPQ